MSGPRIGFALGGGVARGWAHIGVLRRLSELGIFPDLICGTSMGALVGGFYLAQKMETLAGFAGMLTRFRMVQLLDFTFADSGIIGGKRLLRELERELGNTRIEELATPFAGVAAELATGHEVWIDEGRLIDAIRASISLPGIFKPVKLDGRWLIDGALVNPVPISTCRAMGARLVIAVNLTGDTLGGLATEDRRTPQNSGGGFPFLGLDRRRPTPERIGPAMRQYFGYETEEPNLFGTMAASFNILLDRVTRSRLAGEPPDLVIAPRVGHIGLLDFHRAEDAIEEGAKAVDRMVPELIDIMGAFGIQFADQEAKNWAQGD